MRNRSFGPAGSLLAASLLTAAQGVQLCSDTSAYFGRNITGAQACKFVALTFSVSSSAPTDADLRAGCTNTETDCNQSDASTGIAIMCSSILASCSPPASCEALMSACPDLTLPFPGA